MGGAGLRNYRAGCAYRRNRLDWRSAHRGRPHRDQRTPGTAGSARARGICQQRAHPPAARPDLAEGLPLSVAVEQLLTFIGSRPLVGYYLEFDVAMLNRAVRPLLGIGLPQPCIEVSALYYDYKFQQLPPYQQHDNADIDLRLATLMKDLDLPQREAHDALNDAVMAALAFIKLRHLRHR